MLPIHGPRLIVVLGATVGACESVTTLMLADVLATLRGEPVAALDLNPGQTSLTGLACTSPAATARGLLGGIRASRAGSAGPGHLGISSRTIRLPTVGQRSPMRSTRGYSRS